VTTRERVPIERAANRADKGWLTPSEAASWLTATLGRPFSTRCIQSWTKRPEGLRHLRAGSRILINQRDLEDYLARGGAIITHAPNAQGEP
jgi:hypothetical protein